MKGEVFLSYYILGAAVLAVILYFVITYIRVGKALTTLTQEEFIKGYRKAQLIDVREPKDFDAGHILGARNIPFTQFSQRYKEIRPDKPVYLYDQNTSRTGRAALFLKKKGCTEIYQLRGGFKQWSGKIKTK
ncbi:MULTISPECIES: rhodanese-like domain-containing protein [unclassified Sporosarcina]|uniref:rhodanese-like domain-containing protein n=1 Tax=unclassified Sporosarcina TaxID=2647733 RepID=UPI000C171660|nr:MULTISPECIES: rhodanese-like domain-containing protein [unclassified Sporosarcina]PID00396.1 rhodanese-like domain-containing protein [Sporosarcina sp. P29]PID06639.1 rhodanese-like domain-containing protein [Sporosarcina sp. P30]PID09833.1 rhodanese-like domain-containing protein [Sporosarcina sp. P31]PID13412.1 rhodanese-like domain-containing protein [Sporosarcina sp. P32b]